MDFNKPYRVTVSGGKLNLVIMDATDGLPAAFALMGTRAEKKVALRVSGGCKGMTPEDKLEMIDFFSKAFVGYRGVVWSGGTRQVDKNGKVDPMVTDIPGVVASINPGCVALGSLPRTDLMTLQGDSRLVLDEWGTAVNPDCHGILIVQNGPDGKLDWDGDVEIYFRLMENWQTYAGFTRLGLIAWNGGPITADEIMRSINKGWPTFLIKGSGRATDEIVGWFESGNEEFLSKVKHERPKILVVEKSSPKQLRDWLMSSEFIGQLIDLDN